MPLSQPTAHRRARHRRLALAVLACGTAIAPGAQSLAQSPGMGTATPRAIASDDQATRFGQADSTAEGRINTAESPADGGGAANRDDGEATGIRLGSFVLKPSLTQSVKSQKQTDDTSSAKRTYLETGIRGTMTSNWSRHELAITGEGVWQKNLNGEISTDPGAKLDGDLRLDLGKDTIAHITGGYQLGREDNTDPNAISGASVQSDVMTLRGGTSVQRDLGRIRGLIGLDVERNTYSDVSLSDGSRLDLSDRNRNAYTLRGRIGYELSPALIPYLQASVGKTVYDRETDFDGYRRSSTSYALRSGLEVDLGEKLRGELGAGYETVTYDDARLTEIGALTLDGKATWSPRRGTDVTTGLQTSVEDSTAPGESGAVVYRLNGEIAHELRADLVARLSGATTWRRYPNGSLIANATTYNVGTGIAYKINRYLELNGSVEYEWTKRDDGTRSNDLTAGIGLTLRR